MNLLGKKVILRAMERSDQELLREMLNDTFIESMVIGWSFPISSIMQEEWFNKNYNNSNLRLIIEYEGKPVGLATLRDIDWKNRKAFHGIKLSNNCPKGMGIGTDAVYAIMKYSFEELQLNRLEGAMLTNNIASINLYKKCCWKVEGTAKRVIFKNNNYHDVHYVAALKEDWILFKTNYEK